MVKNETNPALPAPLEFVGQPNGTHSPFYFTPGIYSVNGTKAISGKYSCPFPDRTRIHLLQNTLRSMALVVNRRTNLPLTFIE